MCLYFSIGTAQQLTIQGSVSDENGLPLPGASVSEKGTTNGVITDENGTFMLHVSNESVIITASFLGYADEEKQLNGNNPLRFNLQEENALLEEVIVTALNRKQASKNLGYTIQQLDNATLAEVKSPNFVDNLAGRIAGVTVSHGATGVGSTSKVTIRGEASFTNNNPLFVVDGVPINNSTNLNFTDEAASGFQEVDFGNGAMEVNPDDLATVSVLKGPGAAALYGTRAANGAIIITTKDGAQSNGLGISFNSSFFINQPFRLPDFQNSYGQGNSGAFEFVDGLGGGTNDNISYSWGPALDQGLLIPQFDSPVTLPDGRVVRGGDVAVHGGQPIAPTPFVSHPDNLKDFYENGYTAINNLAFSSGFNKGHFRVSFTDLMSDSYIPGVNLDRKTAVARLTFSPTSKLKLSTSINYINAQSDNRPSNGYGSENVNYSLVAWGPRSLNIESLEDYWQSGLEGVQQYSFNYTFFDNPYFILLENRNSFNRDRLFGYLDATYYFTNALSLQVFGGMDYSNEAREYRRHFSTNRFQNGAYAEQIVTFREINTSFLLNYNKLMDDFSVDLSFGGNRMEQQAASHQLEALSLAQPGIFSFSNAAAPLQTFQFESQKRINSFFGFAKIGFKNWLFLEVTGRNDWSSALATPFSNENTSFFYPSVSASYLLSNTVALPSWISFAKLRASWAQVGNDTDPYQTSGAFVAGIPFNSQPTFTAQSVIPNENLLPEQTTALEIGADIRFFKDRLRFDITYYNALTENQIISFPVTVASGYTQQVVNGGAVRLRGIEVVAGVTPINSSTFEWNTFLNFSRNVSIVESLPEGGETITLVYSRVYDNVNQTVWFQVEEGGRIGDMYGTGYLKNEEGRFVLDQDGNFIADNTLQKLGNYNPDFILGFSNQIQYKNWNVNFLLDWRQGGGLVSRTLSLAGVGGQLIETEDRPEEGIVADGVVNVGTTETPVYEENTTPIAAESYYRQFYDRNHEENNVYDASYLKLRQVSIRYTFSANKEKGLLKKGRTLSVALIGRNLFAWSAIPHFDPEQLAVQGNQFVSGVEDMSYPSARSVGVRLGYSF